MLETCVRSCLPGPRSCVCDRPQERSATGGRAIRARKLFAPGAALQSPSRRPDHFTGARTPAGCLPQDTRCQGEAPRTDSESLPPVVE